MTSTTSISPLTRIEGHLAVHATTEPAQNGVAVRVSEARCEGEMFRGLEQILHGRDPLDAQQITQRICGVCPIPHGIASVQAQEMAYGIAPTHNGRILQNLLLAANYLHSHILHFYQLAALDFVDVKAVLAYQGANQTLLGLKKWIEEAVARKDVFPAAPFLPRFEGDYLKDANVNVSLLAHYAQALTIRRLCDEMAAVFGGRIPHSTALVPGGVTQVPALERILAYRSRLQKILQFVEFVYIPDLFAVAKEFPQYFDVGRGYGNFLSFGAFPQNDGDDRFIQGGTVIDGQWQSLDQNHILEEVGHSRFSQTPGLHPTQGQTIPAADKTNAYSWIKAPRYRGQPMEVGPLARVMVNYYDPSNTWVKKELDAFLSNAKITPDKMVSVLGRHVARGLEAFWVGKQALVWLDQLEIDGPPTRDFSIPKTGSGFGLTEAPRGALGHWLSIDNHLIKNYQCIVPTTWNCSPRDDQGRPGPVEQAIAGTMVENPQQPIEIGRIVRSFDPCIACAVH